MPAAGRARPGARLPSLVGEGELATLSRHPVRGHDLEVRVGGKARSLDVSRRLIEHEVLIRADLVPDLTVPYHFGSERRAVGSQDHHVASRVHVAGAPVIRALAR